MLPSFKRYTDDMLASLSAQSILSIALNAFVRALLFVALIQLLSLASTGRMSNLTSSLLLMLVFSFIIFSIDLIEKYWAQSRLQRRR